MPPNMLALFLALSSSALAMSAGGVALLAIGLFAMMALVWRQTCRGACFGISRWLRADRRVAKHRHQASGTVVRPAVRRHDVPLW